MLPHSDAEIGPLSTLSASGFSLLDTLSQGIARAQELPAQAMGRAFAFGEQLPAIMPPAMATAVAGTAPVTRPITPVTSNPMTRQAAPETTPEPLRDLLALIADKLDALASQAPGDTVVTLDGREIARAVYRDVREQRVRRYENW